MSCFCGPAGAQAACLREVVRKGVLLKAEILRRAWAPQGGSRCRHGGVQRRPLPEKQPRTATAIPRPVAADDCPAALLVRRLQLDPRSPGWLDQCFSASAPWARYRASKPQRLRRVGLLPPAQCPKSLETPGGSLMYGPVKTGAPVIL